MTWKSLTDSQYMSLSPEDRAKVSIGRPCPWCEELIRNPWVEHSFVVRDKIAMRPQSEVPTELPDGLYGDCPHCNSTYKLEPKIAVQVIPFAIPKDA